MERSSYDAAGRQVAQWDARLWARAEADSEVKPNLTTIWSLSSAPLATDSVDIGWQVSLAGDAGQPLIGWDGRTGVFRTDYDDQLRPVAQYEQLAAEPERCVERFVWGGPEADGINGCGQLLRHDDPAGSRSWSGYDLLGQPLAETRRFLADLTPPDWPEETVDRDVLLETAAYTSRWQRDALGALLSQVDAKGHTQTQRYTVDGQLAQAGLRLAQSDTEQILVRDIVYDAMLQVVSQTVGNGVTTTASYRPADSRLLRLVARQENGPVLQALDYQYDAVGNVMRITDDSVPERYWRNRRANGERTYRYDTLYQLVEASGVENAGAAIGPSLPPWWTVPFDETLLIPYTQRYAYDEAGNLLRLEHTGQSTRTMAVAPDSNRSLLQLGETVPDFETGFDANGNQQELQPGQVLHWNARNQLMRVAQVVRVDGADDAEQYLYDGARQRARKVRTRQAKALTHRQEVRYLPGLELRTDTATGEDLQVIRAAAGRGSVEVLRWDAGKPDALRNDLFRYQFNDHLGSATLELDDEAGLISAEVYYPYGGTAWRAARNELEADYRTIRYSGKECDASGLYYYGFRYYAPWLNRWISPDPAGSTDGLNLYLMTQNNPVTYTDPDGLMHRRTAPDVESAPPDIPSRPTSTLGERPPAVPSRPTSSLAARPPAVPPRPSGASALASMRTRPDVMPLPNPPVRDSLLAVEATVAPAARPSGMTPLSRGNRLAQARLEESAGIEKMLMARSAMQPISVRNPDPQEPAKPSQIFELQRTDSGLYSFLPSAPGTVDLPPVQGAFLFVILASDPGRVYVGMPSDSKNPDERFEVAGHTSLSMREDVLFSGELIFNEGGQLESWNNASGHYTPAASQRGTNLIPAVQLLLPDKLFKDYWTMTRSEMQGRLKERGFMQVFG